MPALSSLLRRVEEHPERRIRLDEAGQKEFSYRPTFRAEDADLRSAHRKLLEAPLKNGILIDTSVPGWLLVPEALKIFELAYHAPGNVLEFGTNRGLSTSLVAQAIGLRKKRTILGLLLGVPKFPRITTVDIDRDTQEEAVKNLSKLNLDRYVRFVAADAVIAADALEAMKKQFSFCFVDHSHAYEPMVAICRRLPALVEAGGFVLFHDYNDHKNTDRRGVGESANEYGVFAAIEDALDLSLFSFYGIYGSSALFRKR